MLEINEIWHIKYFRYTKFYFNVKNDFYETYQLLGQTNPKIKIAQKFMIGISSIPISNKISSDKSFIEHLPQVMPKLAFKFEF